MTSRPRPTMTPRSLWLGGLAALLTLTACAPPAGTAAPTGARDLLEGKADGGFFFERALDPAELGFAQADQAFDPSRYVAYAFHAVPGPVEITTWRDYELHDLNLGAGRSGLTQVLFEWHPASGSSDVTDSHNWSLLRLDDQRTSWTWHAYEVDTTLTLPDNNRYLLVVLGADDLYTNGVMTHTQMSALPPDNATPGGLLVTARYSVSGDPAVGLQVSLGTLNATTDDNGTVTFYDVAPNTYTVKLGPGGYMHVDMTVQPGNLSSRVVDLDHPLGDGSDSGDGSTVDGHASAGGCDPARGSDDTMDAATVITGPAIIDGAICAEDDDWYAVRADGSWTVTIHFDHTAGDLDMEAVDPDGNPLSRSDGSGDEETVTESGPFYVHVYGQLGATNTYTLSASAASDGGSSGGTGGCGDALACGDCTVMAGCGYCASSERCEPGSSGGPTSAYCSDWLWTQSECTDGSGGGGSGGGGGGGGGAGGSCDPDTANDTMDVATSVGAPDSVGAQICASDDDWYEVSADGRWTVTIDFDGSAGDLDMEAVDMDGNQLSISNGSGDEESVTESGPFYVHVYGYADATNTYTLNVE